MFALTLENINYALYLKKNDLPEFKKIIILLKQFEEFSDVFSLKEAERLLSYYLYDYYIIL